MAKKYFQKKSRKIDSQKDQSHFSIGQNGGLVIITHQKMVKNKALLAHKNLQKFFEKFGPIKGVSLFGKAKVPCKKCEKKNEKGKKFSNVNRG